MRSEEHSHLTKAPNVSRELPDGAWQSATEAAQRLLGHLRAKELLATRGPQPQNCLCGPPALYPQAFLELQRV